MSWSNSISGTSNNRFKLKRSHSPDSIGVNNYKKQRLIQDFERLSLGDGSSRSNNLSARNRVVTDSRKILNQVDIGIINVPKDIKKHVEKLRRVNDAFNDERLIYEKLKEAVRSERLQMIHRQDPMELAYQQWFDWVGRRWENLPTTSYDNDNDYNYNYNYDGGYDSDIDMDA